MRTVKSVTATRSMRSRTWRMARLDPMSGAAPSRRMRANCGGRPSARSISSTSAATCVAASSSSHVQPSSVRPGSNTISIRAHCASTTDGMSKTMTLPAGCCADDPSQTATARARTMDRSSCSKRSRTDAGPDATDKARMTDWRSADAPRRRSAPRPCALLAATGTYSTSSIAFTSLLDLSAHGRHSKRNANEEIARLSGFLREGGSERRLPMGHPGSRCPVVAAASSQPQWALFTRDGSVVPRTSVRIRSPRRPGADRRNLCVDGFLRLNIYHHRPHSRQDLTGHTGMTQIAAKCS